MNFFRSNSEVNFVERFLHISANNSLIELSLYKNMELYLCSDTMTKSPFSFSRWLSNYCNLFQLINWRFRSITSHSNQERINVFNNISFRDTMSQHISRKTAENYPSLQILSKALINLLNKKKSFNV